MQSSRVSTAIREANRWVAFGEEKNEREVAAQKWAMVIHGVLDWLAELPDDERQTQLSLLSLDETNYLLGVGAYSSIEAVRNDEVFRFRYGLLGIIFGSERSDPFETATDLTLLLNSAQKLGVDLEAIYLEHRSLGSETSRRIIDAYFHKGGQSLADCNHIESVDKHGRFKYRYTGHKTGWGRRR